MANSDSDDKKTGTRVFKKTSPNGKITTYLGKRDFIDRGDYVDLIDGMVLIDEETAREGRRVTATLLAAFRYGREDLDVLGLTFRKDLISQQYQVYPPIPSQTTRPLTRLQERLKRKLGDLAFPFWFEVPPRSASSVTLQASSPAPGDTGKPCGVDYELKTVVGGLDVNSSDRQQRNSSVRLAIRKLTYAPWEARPQPTADVSKDFMMSAGLLHMEASLDKEMYYHGESIAVNVHLQNNSNKSVKKLKVSVMQIADICLFTTASYTCEVARIESVEGFPVGPGATLSKVYSVCPLLRNNKDKRGLALDGQLKHEDTNLASSTIMQPSTAKESLGIVVTYRVKIRAAIAGPLGGELVAELPFTLTHAKPAETPEKRERPIVNRQTHEDSGPDPLEIDLIQLDDDINDSRMDDDDLIFEDFTRLRLKGADSTDDASPSIQPPSLI
ncbi:arrestin domain protein [Dictyocaulus viviparus]|uniref:Arrestin domain protein n=1 Tax=Dictyocaulus viviparus TaxID=29172 RepID=A0A0D8XT26_DICVI|nr:arrestin domain protein [Dictyocaulus viviparus]